MSGPMHIVYEGSEGRILVTDSCTYCDDRVKTTDVIIAGSFAGEVAAAMALRRGARAFLGNAAGIGLDGAGVSGLVLGQHLARPLRRCRSRPHASATVLMATRMA